MIYENIDTLIKEAMKNKEVAALRTYRALKTSFMEFTTAKERLADKKILDNAAEISIIRKMIASRNDAIQQYESAGRIELAEAETEEVDILKKLLPAEVSEEELKNYASTIVTEKGMQNMGKYIKAIKEKYPTADGKIVSQIVKALL